MLSLARATIGSTVFKGIVKAIGLVTKLVVQSEQIFLAIDAGSIAVELELGSSVACNGVCLTVTDIKGPELSFYLSPETFSKTNFCTLHKNSKVNMETSLKVGDTIDGHFVQGHVDTTTTITSIKQIEESHIFTFALTEEISPLIACKGSVCIDGTSLTVNEVFADSFNVNVIPYTWDRTIFHCNKVGDKVNVESDLLARYLRRLLEHYQI